MESDSNECKKNNSVHFWPIKRTDKAKLNSSGDSERDVGSLESVDDANYSGVDDTEVVSRKVDVILGPKLGDAGFCTKNRPALDSKISNPATNLLGVKEKIVKIPEPLESPIKRLNTEDEALDKIDDINSKRQHPLVNTRVLPKEATTYELETFDKNALVIFNHKKVDDHEDRLGTEKDVEALTRTFKNFGFEVTSHDNFNKDALFRELKKFSTQDFTDYGCVAVAILTHGGEDGKLMAKDNEYRDVDVINYFKESNLVSKPKIFIIQACRGTKVGAVPILQSGQLSKDLDAKDLAAYYILPLESDLLILHSSYPGHASHRDDEKGSWFIQTLCEKIETLSLTQDLDLESIVTEVKRAVAIDMGYFVYSLEARNFQLNKQMPVMTSTLIRKLYLKKVGERALGETYGDKSNLRCESRNAGCSGSSTPRHAQFGTDKTVGSMEHYTFMTYYLREKVQQVVMHEELGDPKPSQFYHHLLKLVDSSLPEDFLRTIWTSCLPASTQGIVASQSKTDLAELVKLADRIHGVVSTQVASTSAITNAAPSRNPGNMYSEIAALTRQMDKLTDEVERLSRSRRRSRSPTPHRSGSTRSESSYRRFPQCWYHKKFGDRAKTCVKPCDYPTSGNARENQ